MEGTVLLDCFPDAKTNHVPPSRPVQDTRYVLGRAADGGRRCGSIIRLPALRQRLRAGRVGESGDADQLRQLQHPPRLSKWKYSVRLTEILYRSK